MPAGADINPVVEKHVALRLAVAALIGERAASDNRDARLVFWPGGSQFDRRNEEAAMEELISRIATNVGIDAATAESAVRIILSFL